MKLEIEISDDVVEKCLNEFAYWFDIKIHSTKFAQILQINPEFIGEVSEYVFDTCVRDAFINVVLNFIGINEKWPLNGDDETYKKSFYELWESKKHLLTEQQF